ncbi:uncharacterized protein LOC141611405 [Silene latifolia]|uniref:uncharacterized protein LOC141611405 n=1 Tax=Silene latifolia TaxID=37657 RepID=UPI003D77A018
MYKQSTSRSYSLKDIKLKHVLQICLLLVICLWLISQVKHSQEKRKELGVKEEKGVDKLQTSSEILRFSRKGLPIFTDEGDGVNKHEVDEEENNHGEDETESEDETIEKEDNEGDEEENHAENEEKEFPGKNHFEDEKDEDIRIEDHTERHIASIERDRDGDDEDTHEEREEPYKADDASSEVAQHVPSTIPETENLTKGHANNIFGEVNFGQKSEIESSYNSTSLNGEHLALSVLTQTTSNANVDQYDPIDDSDTITTEEKKESGIDLDKLQDVKREVQNAEEAMAE